MSYEDTTYITGAMVDLEKVRVACDVLAGLPRRTRMRSPPAAAEYSEGALGWVGHLLAAPVAVGVDGGGYLVMGDEATPYLGQAADVNGELISVPSTVLTFYDLPADYQAAIIAGYTIDE